MGYRPRIIEFIFNLSLLLLDFYVDTFPLSTIPFRVISYNLEQGKVKFHAFYDCGTNIVLIFDCLRTVYSVTWIVHVAANEPSHSVLSFAILADKASLDFA